MKLSVILALCLDAAMLLRVWFDVVGKLSSPPPKAEWSRLAVGLFLCGAWSNNVARDYNGAVGANVLAFLGPAYMGMALIAALLLIREAPQHTGRVHEDRPS